MNIDRHSSHVRQRLLSLVLHLEGHSPVDGLSLTSPPRLTKVDTPSSTWWCGPRGLLLSSPLLCAHPYHEQLDAAVLEATEQLLAYKMYYRQLSQGGWIR